MVAECVALWTNKGEVVGSNPHGDNFDHQICFSWNVRHDVNYDVYLQKHEQSPYDSKPPPALTSCVWNKVSFVWNKEDWKAATGFNFLRLDKVSSVWNKYWWMVDGRSKEPRKHTSQNLLSNKTVFLMKLVCLDKRNFRKLWGDGSWVRRALDQ